MRQRPLTSAGSQSGTTVFSGQHTSRRFGEVRLVSLDVGNTLVTSAEPGLATLIMRAAKPCALLHEAISHLHTRETTQSLVDEICARLAIQPIDLARYRPPEPIVIPGVLEGLALLHTLDVRVVSLSNVASIDAIPLPVTLDNYLDAQYQSFKVGVAKPDAAAFGSMLQAEEIDPHTCVHIGDSWRCDALGALAAGMSAFWLQPQPGSPTPPSHAGLVVVSSFNEAVEILVRGTNND